MPIILKRTRKEIIFGMWAALIFGLSLAVTYLLANYLF
jgi:hypothetical protein